MFMHSIYLLLLQGELGEEMVEEPESELEKVEPPAPQSESERRVSLHSAHCVLRN